jgi:large subunit ribosomal protein L31e
VVKMVKEFKEKVITINLKKAFQKPVTKRAKAALAVLKNAIRKETRIDNIKISNGVNEELWQKGLFKTVRKITVKVVKEDKIIRAYMPDEKVIVKEDKAKKAPAKKETKKETPKEDKKAEAKPKAEKKEDKPKKETTKTEKPAKKEEKK